LSLTRTTALLTALACTAALAIAACGTTDDISNSTKQGVSPAITGNTTALFVQHADAALAAFDTDIWAPYKAGTLTAADTPARDSAVAAAATFYRALQIAGSDAESSSSLSSVVTPLKALIHEAHQLSSQIKHGDLSNISALHGELGIFSNDAADAGAPIK